MIIIDSVCFFEILLVSYGMKIYLRNVLSLSIFVMKFFLKLFLVKGKMWWNLGMILMMEIMFWLYLKEKFFMDVIRVVEKMKGDCRMFLMLIGLYEIV